MVQAKKASRSNLRAARMRKRTSRTEMLATQTIVLISFGTLLSKLLPASLFIQPCVPPKRDEDYVMLCYVLCLCRVSVN